ncbi:MAG: hypothetical protein OXM00_10915 [Paracoccaceae bacterium]|nr:hypothetical protein [Paracoccaceae bacterium]
MYDLAGVLMIGWAFFGKTPPYYAASDNMIFESATTSTLDGRAGTVLLAIGFLFQIVGSLNYAWSPLGIAGYLVLVLFVIVWFGYWRDRLAKKWQKRLDDDPHDAES